MKLNGASIIVECILEQGIDTVFGFPGGQIMPVYDALYEYSGRLRHILTSHEQGASHAADAYARATGKPSCCIATSGPGATNLVTGIATAYMDSVPVVFITGNVPLAQIGTDSFQEVDIAGITIPITKHSAIISDVSQLADAVRDAFRLAASGRPGPVLVDVPKNVQVSFCEFTPEPRVSRDMEAGFDEALSEFEERFSKELDEAARLLSEAERPMLLAGGGVIRAGASERLRNFAEKLGAPVSTTLMGHGAFPASHPLHVGNIGMHGERSANLATGECDLFLAVGTRFSDRISGRTSGFLPNAHILHIDIDRSEIGKNIEAHSSLVGDAGVILEALCRRIEVRENPSWLERVKNHKNAVKPVEDGALHPEWTLRELQRLAGEDLFVATDVGQHQMWVAQYMKFEQPGRLCTSGGMGTMGFGLGAAIGTQLARPESRVVLVTGDGSFRMNLNELATVKAYGLPIVIVLMNNGVLGMVRQWQTLFFEKRYSNTTLERGPDFTALARAFGLEAFRAETPGEFTECFTKAFSCGGPALVECMIGMDEMVRPMTGPGMPITEFVLD